MSQERMEKWSRDKLDDYVLLPALPGFVTRKECFFISRFWHTRDHPDPDGEYLRLHTPIRADLQRLARKKIVSLISFDVKGAYNGVCKERLVQRMRA